MVLKIADTGQQIIHAKEKLKETFSTQYQQVTDGNLTAVFNNLFTRCQTYLRAEGDNFQNLLQHMVTYNNTDC
jgi:hypothetical protein